MERAACYYPDSENLEQIARRYKVNRSMPSIYRPFGADKGRVTQS